MVRFLENYLQSFVLRPSRAQSGHHNASFWTEEYARTDRSLRLAFEVGAIGWAGRFKTRDTEGGQQLGKSPPEIADTFVKNHQVFESLIAGFPFSHGTVCV